MGSPDSSPRTIRNTTTSPVRQDSQEHGTPYPQGSSWADLTRHHALLSAPPMSSCLVACGLRLENRRFRPVDSWII